MINKLYVISFNLILLHSCLLIVVKELSAQCVGADELRQQRAKIQELANNTSAQLKRNVYQNYMQFIETAKEISHLESEMYQLSQLLSEQRALLSTLGSTRTAGVVFEDLSESQQENSANSVSKEEEQKQKLIQLIENVEGAMVSYSKVQDLKKIKSYDKEKRKNKFI